MELSVHEVYLVNPEVDEDTGRVIRKMTMKNFPTTKTSRSNLEERTIKISYANLMSAVETFLRSVGEIPEGKNLELMSFNKVPPKDNNLISIKISLGNEPTYISKKVPTQIEFSFDPLGR